MVIPNGKDITQPLGVKNLTEEEIGRMKKDELAQALDTLIKDKRNSENNDTINGRPQGDIRALEMKMDILLQEFQQFNDVHKTINQSMKKLEDENKLLRESLMQHQRYLEALEAEKRAQNVVLLGIPETNMTVRNNDGTLVDIADDNEKIKLVLKVMQRENIHIKQFQRQGEASNGRNRVILAQLNSRNDRDLLLQASSALKSAGDNFVKIFVKKDVHPMVRKEFNRLRDVERREKEKPENQGLQVHYNAARREVTVDGRVIDQFHSMFFANRG